LIIIATVLVNRQPHQSALDYVLDTLPPAERLALLDYQSKNAEVIINQN